MKELDDIKKVAGVLDRAIVLCDKFTPFNDRKPTIGGGQVRTTAVGVLVAARALAEAVIEEGAKRATG